MNNNIYHLSFTQFAAVKRRLQENGNCFLAEIYGKDCETSTQFYKSVSEIMSFPIASKSFDGFFDWIRDLTWIVPKRIAFIIYNYESFMNKDKEKRAFLMSAFRDDILPWWESEVKQYVVEGTPRQFDVYLIDDYSNAFETARQ